MQKKRIDMTEGPILSAVLLFALPVVLGNLLQQTYTTADALVIGNFCGAVSLAAVGTGAQPVEVVLCLFLGIGTGVSILVSQEAGRGDGEGLQKTAGTASAFVWLAGIPLTVLGILAAPVLLRFMGVPADVWDTALVYTRLVFAGTLGTLGYNMNAGVLRGMGDSRATLWFLLVSCAANIAGDLLLVAGLRMDAAGAGLATALASLLSWGISILYLHRKYPEICGHRPDFAALREMLRLGIPVGINNALFSFGHMALQTLVNAQGAAFMAAVSVGSRISGASNVTIKALSSAAATFSGQNYGAGKTDRLRRGQVLLPLLSGGISLAVGIGVTMLRMPLLTLFMREPEVLSFASRYVAVYMLSQWCYAVLDTITWVINGTGRLRFTVAVNLLMLWAVRIPCALLIANCGGGTWVMLCYPVSFAFGMACMIGYLFSPGWRRTTGSAGGRTGL